MQYILKTCLPLLLLLFSQGSLGQNPAEIEGRILEQKTREPISYANIFNATTQKGTVSNTDGYFRLAIAGVSDVIQVSFIGYQSQLIVLEEGITSYTIYLEERAQLLDEIVVTPKDDPYLFDLISACKRNAPDQAATAKAFYDLKSYFNDRQIELVEGFYNAGIRGYDLAGLELKAGRLALQPFQNRYFASLESSRAIAMLQLANESPFFPQSPITLPKRKLPKSYYLNLEKKYLNEEGDSVYVIDYYPRDNNGEFFKGKIWINQTQRSFIKITFDCEDCRRYPFRPLFYTDSLTNVRFQITKTFARSGKKTLFNHIDFTYVVDYKSRIGEYNEETYSIRTQAIVYAYDFAQTFTLPVFDFGDAQPNDYRKLNAMPYNDFFWKYNDEYSLNDRKDANETFYADPNSLTDQTIFQPNPQLKGSFFEQPYVRWSEDRIFIRNVLANATAPDTADNVLKDRYNLAIKFFVDVNTYRDSTHLLTATIFDPYESSCRLTMNDKTHCFINLYFDLCEIERRKLDAYLRNTKNPAFNLEKQYGDFMKEFEKTKYDYFFSAGEGEKQKEMRRWNAYVKEHLGIDNMGLFRPFEGK
jgi:hypothetical protein